VTTSAQLRRQLAAAEARAERLRLELATALKEAELFRQILGLHQDENRSNIGSNMQAETTGKSRRTRISAGRAEKDTPSRQAAVAADLTDLMIAEITGAGRSTVQAWHSGARAVPRRHAEKLAKRGIPVDCWAKLSD
jgi:hypothetical protein